MQMHKSHHTPGEITIRCRDGNRELVTLDGQRIATVHGQEGIVNLHDTAVRLMLAYNSYEALLKAAKICGCFKVRHGERSTPCGECVMCRAIKAAEEVK